MYNRKLTSMGISIFLMFIVFLVNPIGTEAASTGIITGNNLNVRSSPATTGNVYGKLNYGDEVTILERAGEWYKIRYGDKNAYVHGNYVKKQSNSTSSNATDVTVYVNREQITLPIAPLMKNDSVLVPFREISESIGVEVKWLQDTRQVLATDNGKEVLLTIGQSNALVDGNYVSADPSPMIQDGYTVIPLRFFAEAFDAVVGWNSETKSVHILREVADSNEDEPSQSVDSDDDKEKPVQISTDTNLYSEPLTSSDIVTELQNGDEITVLGSSGTAWLEVEFDDKKGFVYKDYVTGYTDMNVVGRVNTNELNVRSGPSTDYRIVDELKKNEKVDILRFSSNWAQIKIGSTVGYVHSYYLNMTNKGKAFTSLAEPKMTNGNDRNWLTWSKLGQVSTSQQLTSKGVQIKTSATNIEKFNKSHPAIKKLNYTSTSSGTTIDVQLNDGWHYVVRDTENDLRITLLPSGLKGKRIVVDAGHGDHDPGASGATGLREKDVNLDIAKRLVKLLEQAGADVTLTRSSDKFIPLAGRVDIAHQKDADAFVSIHSDSFQSTSKGSTTFYHLGVNPSGDKSKQLSDIAIEKITAKLGTYNRGSNNKSLHVIREIDIPATLIEVAFLSNPKEEALLKTDSFKQNAAQALYETFVEFYN
ncbi:N-acetylmuramoyl-L-alanine amidase [Bacillus solimangrovi]|uniref:SH3b domain-containing protein n=1 Tax=Bacillus solimangrovi TaxID=1305675 RepID=A0A1E5LDM9_9BACI|nr:N-acetylmuramoyl-L-alanine amidase [Bacillus solimangrovi]OEH92184.1 hypothetical protein BFG57_02625 [Bacillus solimangrovi]